MVGMPCWLAIPFACKEANFHAWVTLWGCCVGRLFPLPTRTGDLGYSVSAVRSIFWIA